MIAGADSRRRRWAAMPFIALGVAMVIVDATIVNVAVPVIIGEAIAGISADTARHVAAMIRASGGAAVHPLATLPHGHALVVAASGAVADATRFVSLIGAAFIAVGLVGTLLLPKTAGSGGNTSDDVRAGGHDGAEGTGAHKTPPPATVIEGRRVAN